MKQSVCKTMFIAFAAAKLKVASRTPCEMLFAIANFGLPYRSPEP